MSLTKYLSHCALLSLVFASFHYDCDAFTQQQPKIRNTFSVAIDNYSGQQSSLWQQYERPKTALQGIVEDFVAGSDEKTRQKGNEKYLATLQERVNRINGLEESIEDLGDDELQAKTEEFRQRLAKGEDINGPLLEEAFAVVREAAW